LEPTNDHLVVRAIDGDEDALSSLLGEIGPQVGRKLSIGRTWQAALDVSDVMQVTYLEAFLRIGNLEASTVAQFAAWLERIAQNNLNDAIKGLQRQKRPNPRRQVQLVPRDDSYVSLLETVGWTSTTPSRDAATDEARQLVRDALERLPEVYRQVVELYDLQGRSPSEIAEAMGRSVGATHMLRARAHDRLGEILGPPSGFFSDAP